MQKKKSRKAIQAKLYQSNREQGVDTSPPTIYVGTCWLYMHRSQIHQARHSICVSPYQLSRAVKSPTEYHHHVLPASGERGSRSRQTSRKNATLRRSYRKQIIGLVKLGEFGERWRFIGSAVVGNICLSERPAGAPLLAVQMSNRSVEQLCVRLNVRVTGHGNVQTQLVASTKQNSSTSQLVQFISWSVVCSKIAIIGGGRRIVLGMTTNGPLHFTRAASQLGCKTSVSSDRTRQKVSSTVENDAAPSYGLLLCLSHVTLFFEKPFEKGGMFLQSVQTE